MVEVNESSICLEIKESLSFECNVQCIYDDIKGEVKDAYENEDLIEDDIEAGEAFINYELTVSDKLKILEYIKDDYEYESCQAEYEVSIFDEDGIRKAINDWVEETFEFRPDEI